VLFDLITKMNWIFPYSHWQLIWPGELIGELLFLALLSSFVALSSLEIRSPRQFYTVWQTRQSYKTNLSLFIFNSVFVNAFAIATLLTIAEHNAGDGLLSSVINPLLKSLLFFVAIDLLLYGWHKACHRFNFLWLFHRVHHSERYLNVSTAFRQHFLEIITTSCLKGLIILVLGIDTLTVLTIETLILMFMLFQHTNVSFKIEPLLEQFIIVPRLHRVHHSTEAHEYNHNFGTVLSLWDRLFGTLSVIDPARIGSKECPPNRAIDLIKHGFGWETPNCTNRPANLELMIAEAAFYKAEKRNFQPGHELVDWLEAKAEILREITSRT
jgi:sterol desaturase/sphingolipid hydroxylase (fatty acid hydroxylase superfamily)